MNGGWLQCTILRVASLLAPGARRAEWLQEWQSELWYIPRPEATSFCLGAFQDAFWLRRNNPTPLKRTSPHLESPLRCLAFLATLSAVSIFVTYLLASRLETGTPLTARHLPGIIFGILSFSCLLLSGTLAVWQVPANGQALPWPIRLRRGIFLVLKIVLLQPAILCGFILELLTGPLGGCTGIAWDAAVILVLRWVIVDQQRRCPVCLRLLTNPVVIGTPSRTFLEWYGIEST